LFKTGDQGSKLQVRRLGVGTLRPIICSDSGFGSTFYNIAWRRSHVVAH